MASFLLAQYEKAMSKHAAIVKRRDDVQRAIEIAQEAMCRDIDSNKTVTYYRSELSRVEADMNKKLDYFRSEMEKVEARAAADKRYYEDLMSKKIQQIESAEPDTPAYRKMKADKAKLEKEEEQSREEMIDTCSKWQEAEAKKAQERIRGEEAKQKRIELEEQRKQDAARQEYEARIEREAQEAQRKFDESLARAGPRVVVEQPPMTQDEQNKFTMEALKNAFPAPRKFKKGKKIDLADLNRHTLYSVADLSTVELHSDDENNPDPQLALFEELWHESCVREKVPGSYEN